MKYLRSVVSILGLATATVTLLPFACVLGFVDRSGRLGWIPTRLWAWSVLLTGGVKRLRTLHLERLRQVEGCIVMGNHQSLFDPAVMMAACGVPLRFLAKEQLFYVPIFGWAMWANRHIPIRRGQLREAYLSLTRVSETVARGHRVVVYPEGTRSRTADLLPFKNGGFTMALRSGRPIVPVAVAGTEQVCPKGWHWAGRGTVALVVGHPIQTTTYTPKTKGDLMNLVRQRIIELREQAARLNQNPRDACSRPLTETPYVLKKGV